MPLKNPRTKLQVKLEEEEGNLTERERKSEYKVGGKKRFEWLLHCNVCKWQIRGKLGQLQGHESERKNEKKKEMGKNEEENVA